MKILLIRPGGRINKDKYFIYTPSTYPPLGLLYLGAMLENDGHKVEVLDYYAEEISKQQLKNSLNSCDANYWNEPMDKHVSIKGIFHFVILIPIGLRGGLELDIYEHSLVAYDRHPAREPYKF